MDPNRFCKINKLNLSIYDKITSNRVTTPNKVSSHVPTNDRIGVLTPISNNNRFTVLPATPMRERNIRGITAA